MWATLWAALDRLVVFGAEPTRTRVVEAGKVMSAAGVSAGIDMALILVTKIAGQVIAQSLQLADVDPAAGELSVHRSSPNGNEPAHSKACRGQGDFTLS